MPLGGSSYFLSRLPGELGTYLALTGQVMVGPDLISTNFASRYLTDDVGIDDLKTRLEGANRALKNRYAHMLHMGTEMECEVKEAIVCEKENKENMVFDYKTYGLVDDEGVIVEPNPWIRLEQRAKDLIYGPQNVDLRNEYKNFDKMMRIRGQWHITEMARQMLPGSGYGGHFSHFRGFDTIRRCFYPDDIEQVKELLKQDGTEFAAECLRVMEAASPLSLALTLRLVHEARRRNFPEAMALELGVAVNRATDSEFPIAMENCILSKKPHVGNIWKYSAPIPSSLVDEYFAIPNWAVPRAVNLLRDSLVPVREFDKQISETLLIWVNGEMPQSPLQNMGFHKRLNLQLEELGVDPRDASLSPASFRKDMRKEFDLLRMYEERVNRMTELGVDKVLRNRYFKQRKAYLDKMFESEETYYKEIHKRIEEVFEKVEWV